ncbi:hypothetical protein MalM25_20180 [Planctomycetes bacterium MalM25]|nr:hypothetical protein MalM25_20180 [Planctomycetes bacterium MalM25]
MLKGSGVKGIGELVFGANGVFAPKSGDSQWWGGLKAAAGSLLKDGAEIAVGEAPGVGQVQAAYEVFSGVNMYGEELSYLERVGSAIGLIPGGKTFTKAASGLGMGGSAVNQMVRRSDGLTKQADNALGSATKQASGTAKPVAAGVGKVDAPRGGAGPVRVGQAGEAAVGNIGPKTKVSINGRNRIPDGVTRDAVSEVKNVKKLSFTRQLRDYVDYAKQEDKRFDLYVRRSTELSGPLVDARNRGDINIKFID